MKRMKPSFWASGIREQTPPLGRAAAEAVTWRPTWNFSWVEKLVYSEKLNKAVFTPDRWWVPKDPGEGFGGWRGERRLGRLGISSVQFSRSVMSNCLRPHGLQHTRLPCTLPTAGAYSDSCLLSWWCHPTISSSVIPFSSCLQSFSASGAFPMSQLFALGGQSTGVSASASVFPMNIQNWFPLGYTGSPCSPRDSQESSPTPQFKNISSLHWVAKVLEFQLQHQCFQWIFRTDFL